MKKHLITIVCLTLFGAFIATQCTVIKRKYTQGFYVNTNRKAASTPVSATKRTERVKAENSKTAPTSITHTYVVQKMQASGDLYASAKSSAPAVIAAKKITLPPDSCGDVITFMDGSELRTKIEEISPDYIAYRRCDYLDGPLIKTAPSSIFRIKYGNGMVRVFKHEQPAQVSQAPGRPMPVVQKTNGWAVAAFVSSLLSFLLIPAFTAVIFGIVSLTQFQNNPGKYKGKWMAIFGLILGGLVAAIFILAMFA